MSAEEIGQASIGYLSARLEWERDYSETVGKLEEDALLDRMPDDPFGFMHDAYLGFDGQCRATKWLAKVGGL